MISTRPLNRDVLRSGFVLIQETRESGSLAVQRHREVPELIQVAMTVNSSWRD